ncbi:MAG TPA: hypothetical protein VM901_01585 [Bdellovibrionota bacterium]|jgi:hypothetical protein|nr:hypothetical protein [Bdellovibrionota bacterium]
MNFRKLKARGVAVAMLAGLLLAPAKLRAHADILERKCQRLTMTLRNRIAGKPLAVQDQIFFDLWMRAELAEPSLSAADRSRIVSVYVDTHPATRSLPESTRQLISEKFLELHRSGSRVTLEKTIATLQIENAHEQVQAKAALFDVSASESDKNEFFTMIIGGRHVVVDITKAYRLIDEAKIPYRQERYDITEMVQERMGLNRALGWDAPPTTTPRVQIDRDHARQLSPERTEVYGLMVDYGTGQIAIDGNHRAARRYMDGKDTMDFIVISGDDLGKIIRR